MSLVPSISIHQHDTLSLMWTLHKLQSPARRSERPGTVAKVDVEGPCPEAKITDQVGQEAAFAGVFSDEDLKRFPALRKRNFWCIQRHQARALHYDLRLQVDGQTFSWAIPKGLLGISKSGEASRLAVQTTLHELDYTVHEGSEHRIAPSGAQCGTLLWDIGLYSVHRRGFKETEETDSEGEDLKRRKRARTTRDEPSARESDPDGAHEEQKLREVLQAINIGKASTIHLTLLSGRKMNNHSYMIVRPREDRVSATYSSAGRQKINWFIRLPRGVDEYSWGEGGEEGPEHGLSVKTGRTFLEVCSGSAVAAAKPPS